MEHRRPESAVAKRPPWQPAVVKARNSLCRRLAQVDEDALLVGNDNVRAAVVVEVGGAHLGANAAVVINQVRDEGGAALAVPAQLKPEEHGGGVGLLVAGRAVSPVAFAGNQVFQPVAVHVHQLQRVHLAYAEIGRAHVRRRARG